MRIPLMVSAVALSVAMAGNAWARSGATIQAVTNASRTVAATPGAAPVVTQRSGVTTTSDGTLVESTSTPDPAPASPAAAPPGAEVAQGTAIEANIEDQCVLGTLSASRFNPGDDNTTTFLSYRIQNFCNPEGNVSEGIAIPDALFAGDPRTDDVVTLRVDLSSLPPGTVQTPVVLDLTFTKSDARATRNESLNETRTRRDTGIVTVTFRTDGDSSSADITGTATIPGPNGTETPLFTISPDTVESATIMWEDFTNFREIETPES